MKKKVLCLVCILTMMLSVLYVQDCMAKSKKPFTQFATAYVSDGVIQEGYGDEELYKRLTVEEIGKLDSIIMDKGEIQTYNYHAFLEGLRGKSIRMTIYMLYDDVNNGYDTTHLKRIEGLEPYSYEMKISENKEHITLKIPFEYETSVEGKFILYEYIEVIE